MTVPQRLNRDKHGKLLLRGIVFTMKFPREQFSGTLELYCSWKTTAGVIIRMHTLNTCTKMHRDCWVHTMGGTRISELGGSEGNRIIYSQLLIRKRTDTYSQCHTAIFYCHDWRPYVLIIVTVIPVVF